VLTRHATFRTAFLAASALAHVLLYGALSLAPAWSPAPRTGLVVTELIVTEPPAQPVPIPRPVTPPRPLVRPKPPTKPVEVAVPARPTRVEPPVAHAISAPPIEAPPPFVAAAETMHAVTGPPTTPAPADSAPSTLTLAPPGSAPSTLTPGSSAPIVAALPPAAPAVTSSGVTRTAIPRGGYQVTPSYPASARRLGIEGTALLSVLVDTNGRVGEVVVKQSAGHPDLDRAAADAVRRWRFDPARHGAAAVAMWVELPVEFHLR
jgi:protein TonB